MLPSLPAGSPASLAAMATRAERASRSADQVTYFDEVYAYQRGAVAGRTTGVILPTAPGW